VPCARRRIHTKRSDLQAGCFATLGAGPTPRENGMVINPTAIRRGVVTIVLIASCIFTGWGPARAATLAKVDLLAHRVDA